MYSDEQDACVPFSQVTAWAVAHQACTVYREVMNENGAPASSRQASKMLALPTRRR